MAGAPFAVAPNLGEGIDVCSCEGGNRMGMSSFAMALALVSVLLIGGTTSLASEPQKMDKTEGAKPALDPKSAMDAWMKAAVPGPDHKVLDQFTGRWTAKVRMWMDPSQPPEESEGTAEGKWLMDGRYVQVDHTGTAMGQPFHGMSIMGYDNVSRKYASLWIDTMGTGLYNYSGGYDAKTKTFTMHSSLVEPGAGARFQVRGVTQFKDDGTYTYEEYHKGADGKEVKVLHIIFTRA